MRPSFSYIEPTQQMAELNSIGKIEINLKAIEATRSINIYSFVGKKLGESSLFFKISLHLLTVSNNRKVSPTENNVAKQLAINFLVGGPGEPWMCVVNCSTSFFWHSFMSD